MNNAVCTVWNPCHRPWCRLCRFAIEQIQENPRPMRIEVEPADDMEVESSEEEDVGDVDNDEQRLLDEVIGIQNADDEEEEAEEGEAADEEEADDEVEIDIQVQVDDLDDDESNYGMDDFNDEPIGDVLPDIPIPQADHHNGQVAAPAQQNVDAPDNAEQQHQQQLLEFLQFQEYQKQLPTQAQLDEAERLVWEAVPVRRLQFADVADLFAYCNELGLRQLRQLQSRIEPAYREVVDVMIAQREHLHTCAAAIVDVRRQYDHLQAHELVALAMPQLLPNGKGVLPAAGPAPLPAHFIAPQMPLEAPLVQLPVRMPILHGFLPGQVYELKPI